MGKVRKTVQLFLPIFLIKTKIGNIIQNVEVWHFLIKNKCRVGHEKRGTFKIAFIEEEVKCRMKELLCRLT